MAIDKSSKFDLPNNIRTKVNVPSRQGQIQAIQEKMAQQENQRPVEINQTEDGGVEIDFDPGALAGVGSQTHDENLAALLEDSELVEIGSIITENYDEYKASRQDWEDS